MSSTLRLLVRTLPIAEEVADGGVGPDPGQPQPPLHRSSRCYPPSSPSVRGEPASFHPQPPPESSPA